MISEESRREFVQRGPDGVKAQIRHANYDDEKQRQAYKWLDEFEHGADRALVREQTAILERQATAAEKAIRIAYGSLFIAVVAALLSVVAFGRH